MIRYFLAFLIAFNCFADGCPKNVQPIRKGEAAVCDGYLFSPDEEELAWKAKETNGLLKDENDILNQRLQLYMNESDSLAKTQANKDNTEGLIRIGYFALGVVLTGLVVRNVRP